MLSLATRFILVVVAVLAASSVTSVSHAGYEPPTELLGGDGPVIPLKNAAMIVKTPGGYRYIAGQQDSHITVTVGNGRIRFVDTGTAELREIPRSCNRKAVPQGISARCTIPAGYDDANNMFVEVWPRLGDDYVDGSRLPSMFRLWVLADAGFDVVRAGAGDDFVNGAQDDDQAWGGPGNDWIRTGIGDDEIWGEAGDDYLVATHDDDFIDGGVGNDRIYGGAGSDELWAGAGVDSVNCSTGSDVAYRDDSDRLTRDCESVFRY